MDNPNTNCLEGWQCPECGSFGPFDITASAVFHVTDDGAEYGGCGVEWEDENYACCAECDKLGTVSMFTCKRKYSVLLLYPDYLSDGPTTYYHLTEAANPKKAAARAQRAAAQAQVEGACNDYEDFLVLLVIEGHHDDLPVYETEIKEV